MSVASIYSLYGYTYGAEADGTYNIPVSYTAASTGGTTPGGTWDGQNWYECVCSNSASYLDYSVLGNIKYPTISTR